MQYQDARFTPDLVEILFKFRTRTYLVKNNFRNNYRNTDLLCPICGEEDDSQEYIFSCEPIRNIYLASHKCEDIYSSNANTLLGVAKDLKNLAEARRTLLSPDGD